LKRRNFIAALGGAAVGWPFAVRAQQPDRIRRIGVLNPGVENDQISQRSLAAFRRGLQEHGWREGRNIHIDLRWAAADTARMQNLAKEIVELNPDVILSPTTPVTAVVQQATRTIPEQVPAPIDHDGWERLLLGENVVERLADRSQRHRAAVCLGPHRSADAASTAALDPKRPPDAQRRSNLKQKASLASEFFAVKSKGSP
jgi:hypothetical protein